MLARDYHKGLVTVVWHCLATSDVYKSIDLVLQSEQYLEYQAKYGF